MLVHFLENLLIRNSFLKTMTCNPCCILFLHFSGGLGPSPTLELEHYVKTFFYTADPLLVIIEYVPYGDLLGYLRKSRGISDMYFNDPDIKPQTSLSSQQLMKFAWQIADGMRYLSSRNVSCVTCSSSIVLLVRDTGFKMRFFFIEAFDQKLHLDYLHKDDSVSQNLLAKLHLDETTCQLKSERVYKPDFLCLTDCTVASEVVANCISLTELQLNKAEVSGVQPHRKINF